MLVLIKRERCVFFFFVVYFLLLLLLFYLLAEGGYIIRGTMEQKDVVIKAHPKGDSVCVLLKNLPLMHICKCSIFSLLLLRFNIQAKGTNLHAYFAPSPTEIYRRQKIGKYYLFLNPNPSRFCETLMN